VEHVFIINPAAGAVDSTHAVLEAIAKSNYAAECEIYYTRGRGDATVFVTSRCMKSSGPIRFYACGGDGTLNEVVNGAVNFPNASVGCYPCGRDNDFVKYYGGAGGFLNIDDQINGEEYPIDLIRAGNKYCINVCDFGFDTTVVRTVEKMRHKKIFSGRRSFFAGVVKALIASMQTSCRVSVDGEVICSGELLLCTIANGNYVGNAFKCAPRSKNNDGLLDICLVKPISRVALMSLMDNYIKGEHLDNPRLNKYIVYRRGRNISVEGNGSFSYTLDGDIVGENYSNIEVVENAINFIVPRGISVENICIPCAANQ